MIRNAVGGGGGCQLSMMPFVHIAHGGLLPHSSLEDPFIFRIYILHAFNAAKWLPEEIFL